MKRFMVVLSALAFLACTKKNGEGSGTNKASSELSTDNTGAKESATETLKNAAAEMNQKKNDIPAPADVAKAPADAKTTESGLAYKVLTSGGKKDHPGAADEVTVHYTGWTTDGKMFDSSVSRGEKISFPLNRVIAGWTEGLQLMAPGDKFRFWIPEALAYQGRPGKPAGVLVFDVELFEYTKAPEPPKTPEDVAKAPKSAKTTKSGLAYKVLSSGEGKTNPGPTSVVSVHYSGWTTDGKMFDSSVTRGQPATFPLNGVIAGWTEVVQLMKEGDKIRTWIPEDLAYKGQPGAPAGTLVFDIELLKIVKQ